MPVSVEEETRKYSQPKDVRSADMESMLTQMQDISATLRSIQKTMDSFSSDIKDFVSGDKENGGMQQHVHSGDIKLSPDSDFMSMLNQIMEYVKNTRSGPKVSRGDRIPRPGSEQEIT